MEPNGETTSLIPPQLNSSENNGDSTVNMEEFHEEDRRGNYAVQLVAPITMGLSITALVFAGIVTLTAIVSHQPSSPIDKYFVSALLHWIATIYYCIPMIFMLAQFIIMKKETQPCLVNDSKQYNKFIIFIVLLIFLPASELYLIFGVISNILVIQCEDAIYTIRAFVQLLFIPSVTLYTLKMCGKRVIGSRAVVIITKSTIATVAIACISKWIYLIVEDQADNPILHLTEAEMDRCQISNSTIDIIASCEWSHHLYPYILILVLVCPALLYAPYNSSRVGVIRSLHDTSVDQHPSRSPFRWQGIPIVVSLIVLLLGLLQMGMNTVTCAGGDPGTSIGLLGCNMGRILVCIICILAVCILFQQIPYTKAQPIEVPADRVLLWISTLGPMLTAVLHFEGMFILFRSNKTDLGVPHISDDRIAVHFTICIANSVCVILQSVMLDIGLRRSIVVATPMVRRFRPALILMVANVGLFINGIYMNPVLYINTTYGQLYGRYLWHILYGIYYPLCLFYRILVTSLWYKIYKNGG